MHMQTIIDALNKENANQPLLFKGVPSIGLSDIQLFLNLYQSVLFPGVFFSVDHSSISEYYHHILEKLEHHTSKIIGGLECFEPDQSKALSLKILNHLSSLKYQLRKDINAIFDGDPAANTLEEVVLAYPSFEAIMIYRIAHQLSCMNLSLFARMCASIAHRRTGIDIHPKAKIGESFCIDHGTGIVIGETAIIGNNVKLYQGVTIGALSVSKKQKNTKRHPTIENDVTIYARTTILGGDTVIGAGCIIGGNVWLTSSVPPNSKVYAKALLNEFS